MTATPIPAITDAASPDVADPSTGGISRAIVRSPRGVVAIGFLVLVILACCLAGVLSRHDPLAQQLTAIDQGPSAHHLLGTDELGRDVFSRLLYGGQASLLGVVEAVAVLLVIAVPLGVTAGYLGGTADKVITRLADLAMSIPVIIILLALLSIFGRSMWAAMVAFGALGAAGVTRVVRSAALGAREELYVSAARIMGLRRAAIVVRHILPRCRGVIVVQTSLFAALALGVQTGLTYLSLGPAPPAPTWGGMVADAASNFYRDPWLLVPSGGIIALTVIALGVLGDVVRDAVAQQHSAAGGSAAPRPGIRTPDDHNVPEGEAALLAARHLTVAFGTAHGPVTVVQDVSLVIRPGEALGVVGESGSGKTVTAKALIGLLPRNAAVTNGSVRFEGRELARGGRSAYRSVRGRGIGIVSQEPMRALDPSFRVGSSLAAVVRRVDGLDRNAARDRVLELLEKMQIADPAEVARRYPHQISGGMAQRVAIAMALAGRPKLLIADEPTTALDVTVQAEILDLLRLIQAEAGMALLLVSHDLGVVADLCARVVVMYAGQVVESAPTASIFENPGHPYTRALLASSPQRAKRGQLLSAIPGTVPSPRQWPVGCHFAGRCDLVGPDCTVAPVPLRPAGPWDQAARCIRVHEVVSASEERR